MHWDLSACTLRSWRDTDVDALVRHANDREVWINLRDQFPHPYTIDDAREWVQLAREAQPETSFAIAVDGEAVGGIGITLNKDVHRHSAEVGYWIGRAFWGRGIATDAVRAISSWAFANFDLCRLYAGVFAWNPASARVLEKAGFTLEGRLHKSAIKDGHTTDELLYALIREE